MSFSKPLVLVLGVAAALVACGTDLDFGEDEVNGSGDVIEESRRVGDFDEIDLAGEGHVLFGAASEGVIEIETDDNLMDLIEVEVDGDRLIIGTRSGVDIEPSAGVEYRLACPSVEDVRILGAGTIDLAGCTTSDDLDLAILGAGTIEAPDLDVEGLDVDIAGAGDVVAIGEARELQVVIPGAGRFDGADLEAGVADVEILGDGSVVVWATDTLEVSVLGRGDVAYYGSPTVTQSVVGVGSVEGLGDR